MSSQKRSKYYVEANGRVLVGGLEYAGIPTVVIYWNNNLLRI